LPIRNIDLSELHGREALIRDARDAIEHNQTLFGLEGGSGVGKSTLVNAISKVLTASQYSAVANLNAAQLTSEDLAIAAIYSQLQQLGRDPEALILALKDRVTTELPQTLKSILGAVIADVAKLATDKAENTIEAAKEIITGESRASSVEAQLAALDRDNQRYFLIEFLQALVGGGNPVVITIDNLDAADVSLVSFVRFLIKSKPSGVALVLAHNSEVGDNSDWDNIIADLRARGGWFCEVRSLDRTAIGTWFRSDRGRWPTEGELDELHAKTHGRAMALKLAFDAMRDGIENPIQLDYAGYYERRRRGLSSDARTVAELLAVINIDASVPENLLASAAQYLKIENIGPALDELRDRRLLKETGRNYALAHSLAQRTWRDTINAVRAGHLAEAWFSAVSTYSVAQLTSSDAAGLLPIIAKPLLEHRPAAEIADIGQQLISVGQTRSGLELLDRTWKFNSGLSAGDADVLQHAIIAARTRLELGRYEEVDEPLHHAALVSANAPKARVQILLLQMKLALRRNAYPALWSLSEQLDGEAERDEAAVIESEQILNVAYRDLLQLKDIESSSNRLRQLRGESTPLQQNSIDRSLARSFAKLGKKRLAVKHGRLAVESSVSLGSIRVVGNSHLALAEVLRYRRDFEPAIAEYRTAAAVARATGNRDSLLWSLLGEAAAHIEAGEPKSSSGSLNEVFALLDERGYVHPLETAHSKLLSRLAGATGTAVDDILSHYERLGINWPKKYLQEFLKSGKLGGPTPI
jgi:ABC-type branched-subunit amino acid transport system ATPase component